MTPWVGLTINTPEVLACSPNRRQHWAALHRARADLKQHAIILLHAAGAPTDHWAGASATVFAYGPRAIDGDNLTAALKPVWDACESYGLVANDRGLHVHPPRSLSWGHYGRVQVAWRPPWMRRGVVCVGLEPS